MAESKPVRTGDDKVDRDLQLYTPLRRKLGTKGIEHLANAVRNSIVSDPSRPAARVAQDAIQALEDGMDDIACAYNPETGQRQWYNSRTQQWGGPC